MRAVVEAPTDLIPDKPPSRVSTRAIADKATINHGLIHRHFGSKKNLILHVIDNWIVNTGNLGKYHQNRDRLPGVN